MNQEAAALIGLAQGGAHYTRLEPDATDGYVEKMYVPGPFAELAARMDMRPLALWNTGFQPATAAKRDFVGSPNV